MWPCQKMVRQCRCGIIRWLIGGGLLPGRVDNCRLQREPSSTCRKRHECLLGQHMAGYKGSEPKTMAETGSKMDDLKDDNRPDPEGRPQNSSGSGKPAGRPLEAEQVAGLKAPRMARRRARVKVRDRPADRQPAEREMTFSLTSHTSQSSSACLGLSAVGHASQRRPLLVGRPFLSGMTLDRQKKKHRKRGPSRNGESRLSGTS